MIKLTTSHGTNKPSDFNFLLFERCVDLTVQSWKFNNILMVVNTVRPQFNSEDTTLFF